MKIFLAGATGAIGRRLVPMLIEANHEVVGMTRTAGRAAALQEAGAQPVIADGLDRAAVLAAVTDAAPDVVVHELTALSALAGGRHIGRTLAPTNRLRTEGTDNLLAAARRAGVRRFVAQSFAGWPYARTGGPVKTEEDPLDPVPPPELRPALDAIRHVETAVLNEPGMAGIVLRYGGFYGPGTSLGEGGAQLELVRRRRMPIVGDGGGVWSLVHIRDAAAATVAAVEHGDPGVYNVVDDEPAPVSAWLPALAEALGAKPPLRVPVWLARLTAGEGAAVMMTQIRGAANAKAKKELGWTPHFASWREGFRTGLG